MRLSAKGRYAVTAMMDLAIHQNRGPVSLNEISICQSISLSYLEQLFARLRRKGLVEGVRGPGGGYRLTRAARDITMAEIIAAVDDSLGAAQVEPAQPQQVPSVALWHQLSHRIYDFLDHISLGDFIDRPDIREIAARQDDRHQRERHSTL